jgi:hypothetical protein
MIGESADRKTQEKRSWEALSFLSLSLVLAFACAASIVGLLWAVYYRLANTSFKGRGPPPKLPLELVDRLSLVAVLSIFAFGFFAIGSLAMALRRWTRT